MGLGDTASVRLPVGAYPALPQPAGRVQAYILFRHPRGALADQSAGNGIDQSCQSRRIENPCQLHRGIGGGVSWCVQYQDLGRRQAQDMLHHAMPSGNGALQERLQHAVNLPQPPQCGRYQKADKSAVTRLQQACFRLEGFI